MEYPRAGVLILAPFVAGYYLSYLFRTINALIADRLAAELALTAAQLGLLTAAYFVTFAAIQLPLGVWLDRHGPRRVQSVLLSTAAVGATTFSLAGGFVSLLTTSSPPSSLCLEGRCVVPARSSLHGLS